MKKTTDWKVNNTGKLSLLYVVLLVCWHASVSVGAGQPSNERDNRFGRVRDFTVHLNGWTIVPLENGAVRSQGGTTNVSQGKRLEAGKRSPAQLGTLKQAIEGQEKDRLHVILQFDNHPTQAERLELKNRGVELLMYVPDHAWLATVRKTAAAEVSTNAHIRWGAVLNPADKVSPRLATKGVAQWGKLKENRIRLMVKVFGDIATDTYKKTLENKGLTIVSADGKLHVMTVEGSTNLVDVLSREDAVESIEDMPPPPTTFNDVMRNTIGADVLQAVPQNLTGAGVKVGIWDGGCVDRHDDFDIRATVVDAAYGVSDHATHVTGIFGGSGLKSASQGGTDYQWRGVAPQVGIVSFDFYGQPWSEHDNALNAYHVDLSQNSWGYVVGWDPGSGTDYGNRDFFGDYTTVTMAYDDIVRGVYGPKIPICFAMGNDRADVNPNTSQADPLNALGYECVAPPATAKNIISVGAVMSDTDAMTTFSNWGPTDDGRLKPELVAPGDHSTRGGLKSTIPGNNYATYRGTSMACPVVTGALALLIQRARNLYSGLDLLPSTFKALLTHTAVDLGHAGPDYQFGFGRVNVEAADSLLRSKSFVEAAVSAVSNQIDNYRVTVKPGDAEIKVTLAWDDFSGPTLVNDLDLVLIDPSSVEHLPLVLDPANPDAVATQGVDRINNIEQVIIANPQAGEWVIRVKGTDVPEAPQAYSLVSSNLDGTIGSRIIVVNNDGTQDLVINGVSNTESWISVGMTAFTVPAGKSRGLLVSVDPAGLSTGSHTGALEIQSNDPQNPLLNVPVTLTIAATNQAPGAPHSPLPLDGASGVLLTPTLSWRATDPDIGDHLTYNLYMGATSNSLSLIAENQVKPQYDVSGLNYDTNYFWKVVAVDQGGLSTTGSVWSFRTFTATGDEDGDGLSNEREIALGADPYRADSDGDGYSDKEEVARGSNPLDASVTPATLASVFFDNFSDGNADDWTKNSDFTTAWGVKMNVSHSDHYSLRVAAGADGSGGFYGEVVSGLISVKPSMGYRLSAYVQGKGKIVVYEYDQFGVAVAQHATAVADFASFNLLSDTFTTTATTRNVRLGVVSLQDSAYFDDVRLEQASSMLLYSN